MMSDTIEKSRFMFFFQKNVDLGEFKFYFLKNDHNENFWTIFWPNMTPKHPKKPKIQKKRTDTIKTYMFMDPLKVVIGLRHFRHFQAFGFS